MELVSDIFIVGGAFFVMVAAIGLNRFSDLYSRMHATTKATSFGMLLLLLGVGLYFNLLSIYVKSALIIVFIYLTAPLAAHAVVKSLKK